VLENGLRKKLVKINILILSFGRLARKIYKSARTYLKSDEPLSIDDSEFLQSAKAFPEHLVPFFIGVRRYVEEQVKLDLQEMISSFHWIDYKDEINEIFRSGDCPDQDAGTFMQLDKFMIDFEEYFDVARAIREGAVVIVA